MADEQLVGENKESSQEREAPKKKKLTVPKFGIFKIPLLLVFVSVLAISTALVVTKVTQSSAATKQEHAKESKKDEVGKFFALDPFTVNLSGGSYLQTGIALQTKEDEKLEAELKDRKPQIHDAIITILTAKSMDDISTADGREKLKAEIKKAVDSLLSYGKIERVYFTTFIMQ